MGWTFPSKVVTLFSSIAAVTRLTGVCAKTDVFNPEISRNETTKEQIVTCLGIVFLESQAARIRLPIVSADCVSYLSASRTKARGLFTTTAITEVAMKDAVVVPGRWNRVCGCATFAS
jgi:hypothetical protein